MSGFSFDIGGGVAGNLPIGNLKMGIGFAGNPLGNNDGAFFGGADYGILRGIGTYNPVSGEWSFNGGAGASFTAPTGTGGSFFAGFGIDQNGLYFAISGTAAFNGGYDPTFPSPIFTGVNINYRGDLVSWDEVLDALNQMGIDIVDYFDELFDSPEDPFPASNAITAMAQALAEFFPTPIVLDLDNDNIEYIPNTATSGVFFDIDADGFAEKTEWIKPDDGFLVRDTNNNGVIDSQAELFGDNAGTTAYAKLASLNTNNTSASANDNYSSLTFFLTRAA
jgi:hypothetical protein